MAAEEGRLTVGELRDALGDFDDDDLVKVRFEDAPSMPVEGVEVDFGEDGDSPGGLIFVLPAQPTDDAAVDTDFTRLCDRVFRGESTIFQVRFGAELMRQAGATTPTLRLVAVSKYFAEARRQVDEMLRSCHEAGRLLEHESEEVP